MTYTDNSLWIENNKGKNDPCPSGYRVPTFNELQTIGNATSWDSGGLFNVTAESGYPLLVLPTVGFRTLESGAPSQLDQNGYYWSSSAETTKAKTVFFNKSVNLVEGTYPKTDGFSLRCIRQ